MSGPDDVACVGTVTSFDDDRGLGEIIADGVTYPFHCVSIADGTRSIAVGVTVSFLILPKLGRYEARDIAPM
jgi:cold shock CspA family protein